jgi:hypothetical protein
VQVADEIRTVVLQHCEASNITAAERYQTLEELQV